MLGGDIGDIKADEGVGVALEDETGVSSEDFTSGGGTAVEPIAENVGDCGFGDAMNPMVRHPGPFPQFPRNEVAVHAVVFGHGEEVVNSQQRRCCGVHETVAPFGAAKSERCVTCDFPGVSPLSIDGRPSGAARNEARGGQTVPTL